MTKSSGPGHPRFRSNPYDWRMSPEALFFFVVGGLSLSLGAYLAAGGQK